MAGSPRAGPHNAIAKRPHKREVTAAAAARAVAAFGGSDEAAAAAVCCLRQPKLRGVFQHVFECTTNSGNNQWMRGKLLQALGYPSRWQPPEEAHDGDPEPRQTARGPPRSAGTPWLPAAQQQMADSSEGSAQTLGRASTQPPTPSLKRAAACLSGSPASKRRQARPFAAAAAAAVAPSSMASGAGTGSSSGSQEGALAAAWEQAAAAPTSTAAGLFTTQDALWQSPSLPLLLSAQGSTGGGASVEAAVHAALGLLDRGAGAHSAGGLAAAATHGPATYAALLQELLGVQGRHPVLLWQPWEAAQQQPALWGLPAGASLAPHPAPLQALALGPEDAAQPYQPFNFWAQEPGTAAAAEQPLPEVLAQAQPPPQPPQHFSFDLPAGTAAIASRSITPTPLAPAPSRQPAPPRVSSMPAGADLPPQLHPRSAGVGASTAVAAAAQPRSISFAPPSRLAQRSPFTTAAGVPPAAAHGASSAPAASPAPSMPLPNTEGQPQALAVEPSAPPAAADWLHQGGACAHFNLPEDTPLNEDIVTLYLSWMHDGPASLHL